MSTWAHRGESLCFTCTKHLGASDLADLQDRRDWRGPIPTLFGLLDQGRRGMRWQSRLLDSSGGHDKGHSPAIGLQPSFLFLKLCAALLCCALLNCHGYMALYRT